jgi:hypothetical protein
MKPPGSQPNRRRNRVRVIPALWTWNSMFAICAILELASFPLWVLHWRVKLVVGNGHKSVRGKECWSELDASILRRLAFFDGVFSMSDAATVVGRLCQRLKQSSDIDLENRLSLYLDKGIIRASGSFFTPRYSIDETIKFNLQGSCHQFANVREQNFDIHFIDDTIERIFIMIIDDSDDRVIEFIDENFDLLYGIMFSLCRSTFKSRFVGFVAALSQIWRVQGIEGCYGYWIKAAWTFADDESPIIDRAEIALARMWIAGVDKSLLRQIGTMLTDRQLGRRYSRLLFNVARESALTGDLKVAERTLSVMGYSLSPEVFGASLGECDGFATRLQSVIFSEMGHTDAAIECAAVSVRFFLDRKQYYNAYSSVCVYQIICLRAGWLNEGLELSRTALLTMDGSVLANSMRAAVEMKMSAMLVMAGHVEEAISYSLKSSAFLENISSISKISEILAVVSFIKGELELSAMLWGFSRINYLPDYEWWPDLSGINSVASVFDSDNYREARERGARMKWCDLLTVCYERLAGEKLLLK